MVRVMLRRAAARPQRLREFIPPWIAGAGRAGGPPCRRCSAWRRARRTRRRQAPAPRGCRRLHSPITLLEPPPHVPGQGRSKGEVDEAESLFLRTFCRVLPANHVHGSPPAALRQRTRIREPLRGRQATDAYPPGGFRVRRGVVDHGVSRRRALIVDFGAILNGIVCLDQRKRHSHEPAQPGTGLPMLRASADQTGRLQAPPCPGIRRRWPAQAGCRSASLITDQNGRLQAPPCPGSQRRWPAQAGCRSASLLTDQNGRLQAPPCPGSRRRWPAQAGCRSASHLRVNGAQDGRSERPATGHGGA